MADEVVKQGASSKMYVTFLDSAGAAVDAGDLDSVLLTLYDRDSGAVINSRSAVEVLDASIGSSQVDGTLLLLFTPADNTIVDDAEDDGIEVHIAKLVFTYTPGLGPQETGVAELPVNVERVFSPA